jgi:hypothetical protein
MNTIRNIKILILAMLAVGALALPTVSSVAAGSAPVVSAAGIKLDPCDGEETAPLLMFVRGISCERALALANAATSSDDPCLPGWHTRKAVHLEAVWHGKEHQGPAVFMCTQKAGKRAFTYKPIAG